MGEIVRFNKDALIEELKQIHRDMVSVYKELFIYKYKNNEEFRNFIENEYKENGIGNDEKEKWNDNFCHRTSYTLINKVLFIRICEDKGFMFNPNEDFIMGEPKDPNIGKKLSARGRDRWISLISNYTFGELLKFAFADMKESFKNIALFKEDKYEKLNPTKQELELKFMLDSKEYKKTPIYSYEENVAKIIEKLDTSKFDFNVPAEGNILGDVYEKFMDRETRKAIGQFYTPDFVIEYILNNTVAEADVIENPFVSVLDPACGSGHFLIMAYDILRKKFEENIDRLREKYADVDYVYKNENMKGKEYWVKDRIHYHILKHCIFGADIDSFAVQLTTINLLLKDLENFTDELNIMECDSLIKWEEDYDWQGLKQQLKNMEIYYTINYRDINGIHRKDNLSWDKAEELVRICEFWAKKYDYVVGNPPYLLCQEGNISVEKVNYYRNNYKVAQYKTDLYHLFFERGTANLDVNAKLSFITPNTYLTNIFNDKLRSLLLKYNIDLIVDLPKEVFKDASVDVCIILLQRNEIIDDINIFQYDGLNFSFRNKVKQRSFNNNYKYIFNINVANNDTISNVVKLKDICEVYFGIQTMDKNKYVSNSCLGPNWKPCINGKDIKKYEVIYDNTYILYESDKIKSGGNRKYHMNEKIVVRQIGNPEPICAYEEGKFFSLNTVYNIIMKSENFEIKYILGIMNSDFIKKYWVKNFSDNKKLFPKIKKHQLESIPIKIINKEKQKVFVNLVDKVIESKIQLRNLKYSSCLKSKDIQSIIDNFINIAKKEEYINAQIWDTERIINKMVDDLYIENNFKIHKFNILNQELKELIDNTDENNLLALCEQYNLSLYDVLVYKQRNKSFNNMSKLYSIINNSLKDETIKILRNSRKFLSLNVIRDILQERYDNFEDLMNIMRKDNPTKKSKDIVKEALNQFTDTWNSYIKNINAGKETKELVKYYDSNYYGLSEWDDEIHKEYFIDAIKEYTEISPNEKKARDILKLFEVLNIKDKEDYMEIFNSQIKKAFRK